MKLTLEKCKEVCPDFRFKPANKPPCMFVQDSPQEGGQTCALPRHFVCELVLYKRAAALREQIQRQAVSVTSLAIAERCPRAFTLRYDLGLHAEESWSRMEDAFNIARARVDSKLSLDLDALDKALTPIERAKVRAALRFYRSQTILYAPGDVTCAREVLFQHGGEYFIDAIDAVRSDLSTVYRWKFEVSDFDPIDMARQAAVYLKAVPEASRYVLACIRKPGMRPGKNETPAEFEVRVHAEMTKDPTSWIRHFELERSAVPINAILDQMAASWQRNKPQAPHTPHLSACHDCEWKPTCGKHVGATTEELVAKIRTVQQ